MVLRESRAVVLCTFNTTYSYTICSDDMCLGKGLYHTTNYYSIEVSKELSNLVKRKQNIL